MFSAFRMGTAASGRGLCDIDGVLISVSKSLVKKLVSPCTKKILNFCRFPIGLYLYSPLPLVGPI